MLRGIRKLTWREIGEVIKTTFKEFFQEQSFFHGAALAYYAIFALIPTLYLAFATFGQIVGQRTMLQVISELLREQVGIKDISGIMDFLRDVDFERGNALMNTVGIVALLFSSTALLASLKASINQFFNIEVNIEDRRKLVLNHLLARLIGLAILAIFGFTLIVVYFGETILISFGNRIFSEANFVNVAVAQIVQHGASVLTNMIIFFIIFKYLHDGKVHWKLALGGSFLTSLLLYMGQVLIKFYLGNFFFAADLGIAGTLLVILLWMFYTSQIIFFGAKFTAVYGRKVGKPILPKYA